MGVESYRKLGGGWRKEMERTIEHSHFSIDYRYSLANQPSSPLVQLTGRTREQGTIRQNDEDNVKYLLQLDASRTRRPPESSAIDHSTPNPKRQIRLESLKDLLEFCQLVGSGSVTEEIDCLIGK